MSWPRAMEDPPPQQKFPDPKSKPAYEPRPGTQSQGLFAWI